MITMVKDMTPLARRQRKNRTHRAICKAQGLKHYRGTACLHCRGTVRYVNGGKCVPCTRAKLKTLAQVRRHTV